MTSPVHRPDPLIWRRARGFTLIELMITLLVLAILVTIALPSFRDLVMNTRLSTASSELQTAFGQARSEAVTRRLPITVCPSDGANCLTWNNAAVQSVVVFTDPNATATFTATDVLKSIEFNAGSLRITTDVTRNFGGNQFIRFNATGMPAQQGILTICDSRTGSFGRQLQVFPVGRVEATKGFTCP